MIDYHLVLHYCLYVLAFFVFSEGMLAVRHLKREDIKPGMILTALLIIMVNCSQFIHLP